MYEKQMELFEEGGLKDEGGMVDEVSGNDVPVGSTRKEVRDDIPAMLSEGEFVFPADVVRYIGLENLMRIRQDAKQGLKQMEAMGQMGNGDEAVLPDDMPFGMMDLIIIDGPEEEMEDGEEPQEKAQGGIIHANKGAFITPEFNPAQQDVREYKNEMGASLFIPFLNGEPVYPIPTGYSPASNAGGGQTFKTYRNTQTGEVRTFQFVDGKPVIPIPSGFEPYTEGVRDTGTDDDRGGEPGTAPEGVDYGSMNAAELAEAAKDVQTASNVALGLGVLSGPVGLVGKLGTAISKAQIANRAEELGIPNPLGDKQSPLQGLISNITNIFSKDEETTPPTPTTPTQAPTTPTPPTTPQAPEEPQTPGPLGTPPGRTFSPDAPVDVPQGPTAAQQAQAEEEAEIGLEAFGDDGDNSDGGGENEGNSGDANAAGGANASGPSADSAGPSGNAGESEAATGGVGDVGLGSGPGGLNKGGLASKKQMPTKRKANKNRGIAARKKKK